MPKSFVLAPYVQYNVAHLDITGTAMVLHVSEQLSKGADQTARMHRLVCDFVSMWQKRGF